MDRVYFEVSYKNWQLPGVDEKGELEIISEPILGKDLRGGGVHNSYIAIGRIENGDKYLLEFDIKSEYANEFAIIKTKCRNEFTWKEMCEREYFSYAVKYE
jgi:hypothetical protein